MEPQTHHPSAGDEWAKVMAGSPDPRERAVAAAITSDPAVLSMLGGDEEVIVRECVATNSACPLSLRAQLSADPDPVVRLKALERVTAESVIECVKDWVRQHGVGSFDEFAAAIR